MKLKLLPLLVIFFSCFLYSQTSIYSRVNNSNNAKKSYLNVQTIKNETEPNNDSTDANFIQYGDTVNASINPTGDVDYYKFYAQANDTVQITAYDVNGSALYGWIWLYNEQNNWFGNSVSGWYGSSSNQIMLAIIPSTGTYYIRYAYMYNGGNFPNSSIRQMPVDLKSNHTDNIQSYNGKNSIVVSNLSRLSNVEKGNFVINDLNGKVTFRKITSKNNNSITLNMKNSASNKSVLSSNESGDYNLTLNKFSPSSPTIITYNTEGLFWDSTEFNSNVNPNGLPTNVTFEYGLTTSYGNTVDAVQNPINGLTSYGIGTSSYPVNLSPNTTYHFRVKASNSLGITYSGDYPFTTPSKPVGWAVQNSGTKAPFSAVDFVNANNGVAVSYLGTLILITTDGGRTWVNK